MCFMTIFLVIQGAISDVQILVMRLGKAAVIYPSYFKVRYWAFSLVWDGVISNEKKSSYIPIPLGFLIEQYQQIELRWIMQSQLEIRGVYTHAVRLWECVVLVVRVSMCDVQFAQLNYEWGVEASCYGAV